ncbi:hypothetical protein BH18ACI2_BH18ACI2_08520 [soil metagenome]
MYVGEDVLGYRLIPGETPRLLKLAEAEQQAVADQLAQFFEELHGVPVAERLLRNSQQPSKF